MIQLAMDLKSSPRKVVSKRGSDLTLFSYITLKKGVLQTMLVYAIIYGLTFGVLFPLVCSTWVYSPYYSVSVSDSDAEATLMTANSRRHDDAIRYLGTLDANNTRSWYLRQFTDPDLDIIIVVVTVDRSTFNTNPRLDHLTQTVTRLDREIRHTSRLRGGLLVCNVDPHPSRYLEAVSLSAFYPTVQRVDDPSSNSYSRTGHDVRELEKLDYVFCLRAALNVSSSPRYVLVVEDDTEPYTGMLASLAHVLERRIEHRQSLWAPYVGTDPWLFLKLYYPERWSGFGWDWRHLGELMLVGCVTGTIGLATAMVVRRFGRRRVNKGNWMLVFHCLATFVYGVVLALAVGRQHLMQLRRMTPHLVTVREAPDCCTPAVLYPRVELGRVTRFLDRITCRSNFGLDLALDQFAANRSYKRFLVEPNLFHHRGFYSTLTKPKQRVEFLFDI